MVISISIQIFMPLLHYFELPILIHIWVQWCNRTYTAHNNTSLLFFFFYAYTLKIMYDTSTYTFSFLQIFKINSFAIQLVITIFVQYKYLFSKDLKLKFLIYQCYTSLFQLTSTLHEKTPVMSVFMYSQVKWKIVLITNWGQLFCW